MIGQFDPEGFIKEQVQSIESEVGNGKAVIAASGGVDSTVCAVLTFKAVGERLVAAFIDDGLMREGEPEEVTNFFRERNMSTRLIDAKGEFFDALRGILDPEAKRKAFRDAFYRVLGRVLSEEGADCLIQGTIAADISETVRGIKTQHNVLEQIGIDYGLRVIEPLREIYKPQVREVARCLGMPLQVSERRPFPGPGLATRVLGEVTPERVDIVRKATRIVESEAEGIEHFQSLAVLLSDKATGIREGKRAYGDIVVVRVVRSEDAMRAEAAKVPWQILRRIGQRIISEIPQVVHVLYSITDKPPATIEFQ